MIEYLLRRSILATTPFVIKNGADIFYDKGAETCENATDPQSSGCPYKLLRVILLALSKESLGILL